MPAYLFNRKGTATVDGPRREERQQRERSARQKAACERSSWRFLSPSSRGHWSPRQEQHTRGFARGRIKPVSPWSRSTASAPLDATSVDSEFSPNSTRTGPRLLPVRRKQYICAISRTSSTRRSTWARLEHQPIRQLERCRLEARCPLVRGLLRAAATTTGRTIRLPGPRVNTRSSRAPGHRTGVRSTPAKLETQRPLSKTRSRPRSRVKAGCLTGSTAKRKEVTP